MYKAAATPLFDVLKSYHQKGASPFFMPGHKLGRGLPSVFQMDLTELAETDNLHIPEGPIKTAQELAAHTFGAKDSFFLVNGSTSGIQAMFLAALGPGDKVLIARNCHLSCISALVLTGAVPVFLEPEFIPEAGVYGGVKPERIKEALSKEPGCKAVYVTSPDYYGFCSDLSAIADITHRAGALLLVDEAHGCHFAFHPALPPTALEQGADLCVQSAHKTLPALTQSGYLHSGGALSASKLHQVLRTLLSSSPSYLLMAYLDIARAVMEQDGEAALADIMDHCNQIKRLNHPFAETFTGRYGIHATDPSRICVFGDFTCFDFDAADVTPELANSNAAVFLPSLGTNQTDYSRLEAALSQAVPPPCQAPPFPFSKSEKTPRECFFSPTEVIPLPSAKGRVCADLIAPYPPGIPLLIPGETVTQDAVDFLLSHPSKVWGLQDGITVLK